MLGNRFGLDSFSMVGMKKQCCWSGSSSMVFVQNGRYENSHIVDSLYAWTHGGEFKQLPPGS